MNLSSPFIHRPVMTILLMLALVVTGILAYQRLPVRDLPNVEKPIISVRANYVGATPETMVNLVTLPLEKELINVQGLKEIASSSSRGSASLVLTFDFDKNMDDAVKEVQAALNRAENQLPKDMEQRPTYQKTEASSDHVIYLILTSPSYNIAEMRELSDLYIMPKIARIEGVAQVDTYGSPYAIRIRINPDLMALRKITLGDVTAAIQKQHSELPLGVIRTGTRTLSLELKGKLNNIEDFRNLSIGSGGVKLKDIAAVTDKPDNDHEFHHVTKDKRSLALLLGVKKQTDANTVAISQSVRKMLPQIRDELPSDVDLNLWFDKAIWIEHSIWDVEASLIFAFVLVVLVIFFSLGRLSETFIPSIALPLSILGTFGAMYLFHFSIDLLSLLALTLSVGFVVDDAIVVLENIVRHHEQGAGRTEASLIGSKQICFTVLSMTLSLVAVFIPLLFLGGIDGRLFRQFSVTLSTAILISGFISLTLTPMLCSRMLSKQHADPLLQRWATGVNKWMVGWYGRSLSYCLEYPKAVLFVTFILFGITIPLFRSLPINLTPEEDRGFLWAHVKLARGLSADKMSVYQDKIEALLQQHPAVDNFIDISWENSQLYFVRLYPASEREKQTAVLKQVKEQIEAIPGTQPNIFGYQLFNLHTELLRSGKYQYLVRGADYPEVVKASERLVAELKGMPEFTFADIDVKNDDPKLVLQVQEDQAKRLGVSKRDLQTVLQQAYSGSHVALIQKGTTQNKVYLELDREFKNDPAAIGKLHVKGKDDAMIPLKTLASWHETMGTPTLYRHDQFPSVKVDFSVDAEVPLNDAFRTVEQTAASLLPHGVSGKLHGTAELIASTMSETTWLLIASVAVMYLVLGILYESFIHPLTILSSLPFAGLGGILTLMFFDQPLSIFSIVGFLLLIGIVKKNGIMMIDHALEIQRYRNISPAEAIHQGAMIRFRPIMMTTIAAIMGAIPIAIGFGEGAETRRGLGLVIAGGLIFSQMLTLYVTPVFYLTFERLRTRFLGNRMGA